MTLRLGPYAVDPPVVLAPMAGITNVAFRRLCREHGAGLYVCEMVTTRALVERSPKTLRMVAFTPHERPRSLQLYGVDPDFDAEPDQELLRFRGAGPLLGFVAGLRDQKGLPTLLGALELLAARGASPRFAIVGNGPLREEVGMAGLLLWGARREYNAGGSATRDPSLLASRGSGVRMWRVAQASGPLSPDFDELSRAVAPGGPKARPNRPDQSKHA